MTDDERPPTAGEVTDACRKGGSALFIVAALPAFIGAVSIALRDAPLSLAPTLAPFGAAAVLVALGLGIRRKSAAAVVVTLVLTVVVAALLVVSAFLKGK